MENIDYIQHIEDLSPEEIVTGIRAGKVTFRELQDTGNFFASKQRQVREQMAKFEEEDRNFANATSVMELRYFLQKYPGSDYRVKAEDKIAQLEYANRLAQQERILEIRRNINEYTPDEIKSELGPEGLRNLCEELGIDYQIVSNYDEPHLNFNTIPQSPDDIPTGYTDVFFWGIPSSGKTCALSAILNTAQSKFTVDNPTTEIKYGATYRTSLVNIFRNNTGYLPAATQKDRTQYMPFLLKKRDEKNYRQISFFELSGEVFKYFYEIMNDSRILGDDVREDVESAFRTLNLLLNSKNQKIHFFFIDYNQETKGTTDKHGLTQGNYLDAAATYFRDRNNIFKEKTDAVYVVVTKADEIKDENRNEAAKDFLHENFGSFMDVIKGRCKDYSVQFGVKIFSIGDVYFKRICKINRAYAHNIVEDLMERIHPIKNNKLANFFNK